MDILKKSYELLANIKHEGNEKVEKGFYKVIECCFYVLNSNFNRSIYRIVQKVIGTRFKI